MAQFHLQNLAKWEDKEIPQLGLKFCSLQENGL